MAILTNRGDGFRLETSLHRVHQHSLSNTAETERLIVLAAPSFS